jgi:hypothetical protein
MANFRATIQGQRGAASRLGSKKSGLNAHINGWQMGVRVYAYFNEKDGEDKFDITLTSGSNGGSMPKHLGTFSLKDLK